VHARVYADTHARAQGMQKADSIRAYGYRECSLDGPFDEVFEEVARIASQPPDGFGPVGSEYRRRWDRSAASGDLDLSGMGLIEFPFRVFSMKNIKRVDLSDNGISEIPSLITKLKNLQVLILRNNELISIPFFLEKLPNLKALDVSNNQPLDAFLPPRVLSLSPDDLIAFLRNIGKKGGKWAPVRKTLVEDEIGRDLYLKYEVQCFFFFWACSIFARFRVSLMPLVVCKSDRAESFENEHRRIPS
jgi:hypothetical protein